MASNSPELGLSTVGLVGLGDIGTATARLLAPFGCKMYYYTAHRRLPQVEEELNVEYLPLEELVSRCDIVSLHCAVTPETTHMVDKALLDKFKPGAILVNTSRGLLVDSLAVRQALIDGRLGADHPLVDLPPEVADRAIYSPHLGGNTGGSFHRAHTNMWTSAQLVLEGKRPNFIVNGL